MASHLPERKVAEAGPAGLVLRAAGPNGSEFVDVFALGSRKTIVAKPCDTVCGTKSSPEFGIATTAPIPITTGRAVVTATIVVRASDKKEITQANLGASTSAQRV